MGSRLATTTTTTTQRTVCSDETQRIRNRGGAGAGAGGKPYYNLSRSEERRQFMEIMGGGSEGPGASYAMSDDGHRRNDASRIGAANGDGGGGNGGYDDLLGGGDAAYPLFEIANNDELRTRSSPSHRGGAGGNGGLGLSTGKSGDDLLGLDDGSVLVDDDDDDDINSDGNVENDVEDDGGNPQRNKSYLSSMQELLDDERSRTSHMVFPKSGRRKCRRLCPWGGMGSGRGGGGR